MERRELEQYLHESIPLSKARGVQVRKSNAEHVVLAAPQGNAFYKQKADEAPCLIRFNFPSLRLTQDKASNRLPIWLT
jgi:hypothetical protein